MTTPDSPSRREAILEAVSFAARQFLERPDWRQCAGAALERLGRAAGAGRVYIFENGTDEAGALLASRRFEWVAAGVEPHSDRPDLQAFSWSAGGFGRWADVLEAGGIIHGRVRELPASERELLERQGVKSVVVVPIFASRTWWGFIGFDECLAEREWSGAEIDALRTAAEIVGGAILRRRREQALREREGRLRQMAETIDEVFWISDPRAARMLYVSPAYEQIWGRSCRSVYDDPRSWLENIHPEDRERAAASLGQQISGVRTVVQFRITRPDGATRWITNLAFPIRDEAGRVYRVVGIARDVTEQKRAEEELRKFKTISDRASYGAALSDLEGRLLYVNAAFAAMHGYRPEELVGKSLSLFHAPEQMKRVSALLERLRQAGSFTAEEVWHKRKDGSVFPTLMNATVITDESDTPSFLSATAVDISQLKRAERALRESEARNRAIIAAIPDMMFYQRRDGTFLDYRGAAPDLLAVPAERLVGRNIHDVGLPRGLVERELQAVGRALDTGRLQAFEYRLSVPRGVRDFEARIVPCGENRVLCVVRDISERKRAEEEARRHQAELIRVSRLNLAGEMTVGLAHELNQPLATILFYARGCVRRMRSGGAQPAALLDAMERVAAQAENAGRIIQRAREFISRGAPHSSTVDINETVHHALGFVEHELEAGGITLDLQLAEGLPPVRADRVQLEQVVLNLVRNAIEATREVEGAPRTLTVTSARAGDGKVTVAVRDTGRGLPAADAQRVFDRFFSTKADGMGLGLSISRSIIEAHGGRLWAVSNSPRGAAFQFALPVMKGAADDQA